MTAPNGTPETRRGVAFAVLSAATGALLLFVPVALLGFTFSVLDHLLRGDGMAWQSVVGMGYTFGGILALISLALLVIPYRLLRTAGRRIGMQQAVMWAGGLLAGWHASVAAIWAWDSTSHEVYLSHPPPVPDGLWYPIAFGVVAVVILGATAVAAKRATSAGQRVQRPLDI